MSTNKLKKSTDSKLKFIDLFSGIGGFHYALKELGHEWVFASDIDKYAKDVYEKNHRSKVDGDITKINIADIPNHDILCAGFPCQPFSNAGHKMGFEDKTRGTLFHTIVEILKFHKPKYIFLENVKHLAKHDKGNTYKIIKESLENLGYAISDNSLILSPHKFGIPQRRERIYILGILKDDKFTDNFLDIDTSDITYTEKSIIDENIKEGSDLYSKYKISDEEERVLNAWDEFIKKFQKKFSGFPIYVDFFEYSGPKVGLQKWKLDYIHKNENFYNQNKKEIEVWINKYNVKDFSIRDRKFEWQAGKDIHSVWDTFIQYRQSGIRCKKPTYFPTLVAMVQTPIIGRLKRRLTPREASRLQSFPDNFELDPVDRRAFKQFGNSVNVDVVKYLANKLLNYKNEKQNSL